MNEIYVGVKFEAVHLPAEKFEEGLVAELIRVGKKLSDCGFCPQNSGNLSFRSLKGFVITRAGSELGKLETKDFVLVKDVDIPGKKVFAAGAAEPSSEAMMHFLVYAARPDAKVILHAHALGLKNAVVTPKEFPYGTIEFARSAVEVLKDHPLVILKNHGFVALGKTVAEAYERLALQ